MPEDYSLNHTFVRYRAGRTRTYIAGRDGHCVIRVDGRFALGESVFVHAGVHDGAGL